MFLTAAALALVLAGPAPAPPPHPGQDFFKSHREKLLARLPAGSVAVFRAPAETAADARADSHRQDSDFWYLTGLDDPNAVAVLQAGSGRYVLFVQPKDFAAEQWTGWRTGVDAAKKEYGAADAYSVAEFWDRLPALFSGAQSLYYGSGGDREFQRRLLEVWNTPNANATAARPAADALPILAALRLLKDPAEQALLREASRLSAEAHQAAMARVAPGLHEYDLKAAMVDRCLLGGAARMSYPPIVASGRNSVILHHEKDDKLLEAGEVLVNDTACEYSMYASDVTRSYPVTGRFSAEQRSIYEIVLAAQKAGFAECRQGVPIKDVHNATVRVIVDGLLRLGILTGDREEIVKSRSYQRFYPHGSSHWIGLNVHDVGSYGNPPDVTRLERYGKAETKLEPGMALTVEPGIYIPERSTQDPRWWNIGIRIEDVVLVTPSGMDCLSCSAPREIADVEKLIQDSRRGTSR
ncbi:MAG TPA: aminopeptidase P N-terminal domain-containing protein [Thermoanaerobaculia bacterium]|nr:aminopeptidase P N-terminal domain-containing protein [Thermoanaerobaculia bacterium]